MVEGASLRGARHVDAGAQWSAPAACAGSYAGTAIVLGGKQLRKLLLPRTEQWLYYAVRPKEQLIVVQTLWGARRGRDPKL